MAHKEIERRFLVTRIDNEFAIRQGLTARNEVLIEQGYFEIGDPGRSFRVRIMNNHSVKGFLTVKVGEGKVRKELEQEIDLELAQNLLEISHHRIRKVRYYFDGWEIDFFQDPLGGIILAERELKSVDEPIQIPDFIEECREVTDSLSNLHLARLATDLRGLGTLAMPFLSEGLLRSVPCIGLVGGPGSGKSGIIKILKEEFPDIHFVPEVATIVIGQVGILPSRHPVQNRRFQKTIYGVGRIFRMTSTEFAIANNKKAIVLDRPEADGAGYFDGGIPEFEAVLGTTINREFGNVDVVIFLETPSRDTYEECKRNNSSRAETYEEAVARAEKIKAIWRRHPNFHLIGNDGGWDTKVDRVRQLIKLAIKA